MYGIYSIERKNSKKFWVGYYKIEDEIIPSADKSQSKDDLASDSEKIKYIYVALYYPAGINLENIKKMY